MSFSKIAKVYDRFNDYESYEQWINFTLDVITPEKAMNAKVMDVGCGTGWFVTLLAPFVEQIMAIDIDKEMLAMAEEESLYENIMYQEADMRDLSDFDQDFTLVTCFADVLCFLEHLADVRTSIHEMYKRLAPGGILLFDVWTPYQIQEGFDGFSYFDSDENGALLWDTFVDKEEMKVEHYLTVFDRCQSSNQYERTDVTLKEQTYSLATYLEILDELMPQSVEVFTDYNQASLDTQHNEPSTRWFFKVVKP